jgi:hypothetical protein
MGKPHMTAHHNFDNMEASHGLLLSKVAAGVIDMDSRTIRESRSKGM